VIRKMRAMQRDATREWGKIWDDAWSLPEEPGKLEALNAAKPRLDVNAYFTVLKHLSMEEGYVLDYHFVPRDMDARPYGYARRSSDQPLAGLVDYEKLVGDAQGWQRRQVAFLNRVKHDGTPQGCLEYVALAIMAEQFCLVQHANYDDTRVVASREEVREIIAELEADKRQIDPKAKAAALAIDPAPETRPLKKGHTFVSVVVFTKWGGFYRCEFVVNPAGTPGLCPVYSTRLAEFNCGVWY
jgi:hypothetical protein